LTFGVYRRKYNYEYDEGYNTNNGQAGQFLYPSSDNRTPAWSLFKGEN